MVMCVRDVILMAGVGDSEENTSLFCSNNVNSAYLLLHVAWQQTRYLDTRVDRGVFFLTISEVLYRGCPRNGCVQGHNSYGVPPSSPLQSWSLVQWVGQRAAPTLC